VQSLSGWFQPRLISIATRGWNTRVYRLKYFQPHFNRFNRKFQPWGFFGRPFSVAPQKSKLFLLPGIRYNVGASSVLWLFRLVLLNLVEQKSIKLLFLNSKLKVYDVDTTILGMVEVISKVTCHLVTRVAPHGFRPHFQPSWSSLIFYLYCGGGVLRFPVPKWFLLLNNVGREWFCLHTFVSFFLFRTFT